MKKYIINLHPYTDNTYSWQELNCLIRPFAMALNDGSGDENIRSVYHNMFLMLVSLFMTHCDMGGARIRYNGLHPMFFHLQNEIKDILCLDFDTVEYSSERKFHKKMQESIGSGYTVVVPCDLYMLPYSKNYMEQHHNHYVIVKGFDAQKEIYYVLDNMHVEQGQSTQYLDFMIPYNVLYNMAYFFHKYYDMGSISTAYFWKLCCKGDIIDTIINVKKHLIDLLTRFISGDISPYYMECDVEFKDMDFLEMAGVINLRNVYYEEMSRFVSKICAGGSECEEELNIMTKSLKKRWNVTKLLIMKGDYGENTREKIRENIDFEKEFHEKILYMLERTDVNEEILLKNQSNYIIHNPLEAETTCRKMNEYKVCLSDKIVYDTWRINDDAFQVLCRTGRDFSFTVDFGDSDVMQGAAFHMGIIVKGKNGKKYLFGNSRGMHLVLFEPEKNDYKLYQRDRVFDTDFSFKVVGSEKSGKITYVFYIKNIDEWEEILTIKDGFEAEYIGMFIKTWEKCSVKTEVRLMCGI